MLLFHHAQGLTQGCLAFADELRAAGHVVHTPDLYDGKTFAKLADGLAYLQHIGFNSILERGRYAADGLPNELAYVGLSLGVMPAHMLAQTRPGATGAVLVSACAPISAFGTSWPEGVPVQIHMMDADALVLNEGDLDAARSFAASVPGAELFLYSGNTHLFVDNSLPDYDAAAATQLRQRVLDFLS